jgi:autotransporter-associated beta strand protein
MHRPRTQSIPVEPLESRRLLTATWVGDIDSNWGTVKLQGFPPTANTNWSGNVLPTSTDILVFPAGALRLSNNDIAGAAFAGIRVDGTGAVNRAYRITGLPVTLTGATGVLFNTGPDDLGQGPTLELPVKLGAPLSIANNGAAPAAVGQIDLNGFGLTLAPAANTLQINGVISGAGAITKTGPQQLLFDAANTYAGKTQVNQGTLRLLSGATLGAIGSANGTVVANGAALVIEGAPTSAETLTLSGNGAGDGAIVATHGTSTGPKLTGPVTLADDATIGVTSATGEASTLEIAGPISGNFALHKSGGGILLLSNPNNTFNSGLTIGAGTLRLGAASIIPDHNVLAIGSGATFDLNNFNERIGGLAGGAGTVNLGSGTLTLGGPTVGFGGAFDGSITGTGGVAIDVGVFQTFSGDLPNTFTGPTSVNIGSLLLDKDAGVIAIPGDLFIGNQAGSGVVGFNNDDQISHASNVTIASSATLDLGTSSQTIASLTGQQGADLRLGGGALTLAGDKSTTFNGAIDGTGLFIKKGTGTLTLGAQGTLSGNFAGTMSLLSGTLILNEGRPDTAVQLFGGTLAGSGPIGALNIPGAGTISPGATSATGAPAILYTHDTTLNDRTTLSLDLTGLNPGADNDQLDVKGDLTLGSATLDLHLDPSFTPSAGQSFVLINNEGANPVTGAFANLPEGAYFVQSGQTFRITYTGGTGNDVVLIRENGPAVLSSTFDFATAPRLLFNFTQDVHTTLGADDLLVRNLDTGAAIDASTFQVTYDTNTNTATFTHAGPLPDGNYRAFLNGAAITNTSDIPIGATTTLDFFAFAGDANHDRSVDFNDLVKLAQNYNTTGKTFPQGDFNYDNKVDFNDLVLLAQRYNTTLPLPATSGGSASAPIESAPATPTALLDRKSPSVIDHPSDPIFSLTPIRHAPTSPKPRPIRKR